MPLKRRFLSSCMLSVNGYSILTDCGEGTQVALKTAGKKCGPIDMICITHFHADHISGLAGLLLTMSNEGRTEPVHIIGPVSLEYVVRSLCVVAPNLPFALRFTEVRDSSPIFCKELKITPFPVLHSIDCIGYTFELAHKGKFDVMKAKKNEVPLPIWSALQKNDTVFFNGKAYTSDMVLGKERKGIKVTYCTDARPGKSIKQNAANADLFICEGMYAEDDKITKAVKKGHMLFSEAAALAKEANVTRLWLTHFSPSLEDPESKIQNAKAVFPDAECGYDGKNIDLKFD